MSSRHINELLQYKTIIFYKEESQFPKSFIQHIKPPYTILNLSVDKKIETLLVNSFYIQKLPCMYINGQIIYENAIDIVLSIDEVRSKFNKKKLAKISKTTEITNDDINIASECDTNIVESITTLDKIETKDVSFRAIKIINECLQNSNFIFIKGTPDRPECGFTKKLVDILKGLRMVSGRDYQYFNIFSDEDVRQTLKQINGWPTFPMIYLNKEFIGGLDVLKEMIEDNSIATMLPKKVDN